MSTAVLQARKLELEAHELFAGYREAEFRPPGERTPEINAFAKKFEELDALLMERGLLQLRAEVLAAGAGQTQLVAESGEQMEDRMARGLATFGCDFKGSDGKPNKSLQGQAARNRDVAVKLMVAADLMPGADSPAMLLLETEGQGEALAKLEKVREAITQGVDHCKEVAKLLLIAHKHSWRVADRFAGESDLRFSDEEEKALKEAVEYVRKEEDLERSQKRSRDYGSSRWPQRDRTPGSGVYPPSFGQFPNSQFFPAGTGGGPGAGSAPPYGRGRSPAFFPGNGR